MLRFLKKILVFSAVLSILTILPTLVVNYFINPYGLFRGFSDNYKTEPNLRSLKNWYILENNDKYQNLFFSDSRGGTYVFSDSTYYNMSYSMGVPFQFHQDIKDILNNGIKIKSVIIMIDEFSIYEEAEKHINQPLRRKFNRNDFTSFFSIPLSWTKIYSILSFNKYDKHITFNVSSDGSYEYNNFTINNLVDTLKTKISVLPPTNKTQQVFYDIEECVTFLRSKKIGVQIGVHPISKKNYINNINKFEQLKSLINLLCKNDIDLFNELVVIDDKNLNSIFYDLSHYSSALAKKVINKLSYSGNNPSIGISCSFNSAISKPLK
jgi:hypothetical protein